MRLTAQSAPEGASQESPGPELDGILENFLVSLLVR